MPVTHAAPTDRSFGLSVGSASILFAGLAWWRGHASIGIILAGVATLLVLLALVAPTALRVPNRIWWRLAQALGWVNSRIILSAFFYGVLTPAGVVMRALGQGPLRRTGPGSGWFAYPARRANPKHFEQMF